MTDEEIKARIVAVEMRLDAVERSLDALDRRVNKLYSMIGETMEATKTITEILDRKPGFG